MTKEILKKAFGGKEWLIWHFMIGMAMGKRILRIIIWSITSIKEVRRIVITAEYFML